MKRVSILIVATVVLPAAGGAAFLLLRQNSPVPADAPLGFAEVREFTPRINATGNLRLVPGARVAVGAQVSGVVRRIFVDQGAPVKRGDLIAKIDDREARARLAQAAANLREKIADSTQASAELQRMANLARANVATVQELLAAETTYERAGGQLEAARAGRELARINLDNTEVRTPIDGVVASVSTKEGETVASSFAAPTFVTIVDAARLECVALVDETDIGRVRVGQLVEFTVDAYPGRPFSGKVERIAPDASIISGVVDYEVTVRVTGDASGLKPQMTANVMIATESRSTLVVPSAAVRQGAQDLYVWKIVRGVPVRTPIRAGARQLDVTEVTSALAPGDTVLTGSFPETSTER